MAIASNTTRRPTAPPGAKRSPPCVRRSGVRESTMAWLPRSLVVLLLASSMVPAAAAETVHFKSATTPPTPLQQRLARERGQPIAEQPTVELAGELHRPAGAGPFPAIVALHGCSGRGSKP